LRLCNRVHDILQGVLTGDTCSLRSMVEFLHRNVAVIPIILVWFSTSTVKTRRECSFFA
jgi:hypothetical protein